MTAPDPFTARAREIVETWFDDATPDEEGALHALVEEALRAVHADAFGAGVEAAAKVAARTVCSIPPVPHEPGVRCGCDTANEIAAAIRALAPAPEKPSPQAVAWNRSRDPCPSCGQPPFPPGPPNPPRAHEGCAHSGRNSPGSRGRMACEACRAKWCPTCERDLALYAETIRAIVSPQASAAGTGKCGTCGGSQIVTIQPPDGTPLKDRDATTIGDCLDCSAPPKDGEA